MQASRAIETGDAELVLTGGVESMSRAPWVVTKPERGFERSPQTMHSTTLGWRMVNPRMPERWTISLGESAELLAERYEITAERQDEFALREPPARGRGVGGGLLRRLGRALCDGVELERDENIRAETDARTARRAQARRSPRTAP